MLSRRTRPPIEGAGGVEKRDGHSLMRYSSLRRIAFLAIAAGMIAGAPAASATSIKCWTNDDGVRECGNVIPPKYSQKAHEELNNQGVTVATRRRAKTPEELAEQARAERERKAQEQTRAEREREQAARDRVLLDTFTSEDELVLAHRSRLAAIDTRVENTRKILDALREDLSKLREEAARQERSGDAVSAKLGEQIQGTERQISDNLSFISERRQEKAELNERFEEDLARYRELTGKSK